MQYVITKCLRSGMIRTGPNPDPAKIAAELVRLEGNGRELVGATMTLQGPHGRSTFTIGLSGDGESLTVEEDHA